MIRPGMFISDRYEIIEKVGSGGMADVYKAKDQRLNRFVAIKILKSEFSADKKFVGKFRGEAQSAAGLSHPNIVNVYDVGEDEGLYYIVMELVEGITLKSFIERKGRLDVKEAIGISIQIAMGMEAAHNNGIVHRDIKPQNIIISKAGKVKVTDFGIAKATSSNTITSNAMGSVHYISPEQARGGYSDERSDIYSLGITMYEMLSGRVPFTGENTVAVALLHIQEEAVPLRQLDESIPISVERIVQKCMQKKPERRYLSASELIVDLKRSITNPNGNFVRIAPAITDSPTKQITDDEISTIKTASKTVQVNYENEIQDTSSLVEESEEAEEGSMDPKIEKIMIIGGIAAAVILAVIIIVLIFKLVSGGSAKPELPKESPSPVVEQSASPEASEEPEGDEELLEVPPVVGSTYDEAKEELEEMGFVVRFTMETSDEYEENYVIEQKPEAGEELEKGSIIRLVISTGKSTVAVPSVAGNSYSEAAGILEAEGFHNYSQQYEYSSSVEKDVVTRTDPIAGSNISTDTNIVIYVSQGPEKKYSEVPYVVGLSESKAIKELENKNLKCGAVSYEHSSDVAKGLVITQGYSSGAQVEEGTAVDLVVSSGPEEQEKVYKYIGNANVSYVPFDDDSQSGEIKIVLTQDGQSKTVYQQICDIYDFPLALNGVEGFSESTGTLQMYLDGTEVGDAVSISFVKVEQ